MFGRDWALKDLHCYSHSSARSAGPMHKYTESIHQKHFDLYRETRTTFTEEPDQAEAAHWNPTPYYSRHGPDSIVIPCIDPLAPFHTAPVFADKDSDCVFVATARREFDLWCRAFWAAAARSGRLLAVRFLVGDSLAVTRTFEYFSRWKMRAFPLFVAPWSAQVLELSMSGTKRLV